MLLIITDLRYDSDVENKLPGNGSGSDEHIKKPTIMKRLINNLSKYRMFRRTPNSDNLNSIAFSVSSENSDFGSDVEQIQNILKNNVVDVVDNTIHFNTSMPCRPIQLEINHNNKKRYQYTNLFNMEEKTDDSDGDMMVLSTTPKKQSLQLSTKEEAIEYFELHYYYYYYYFVTNNYY
jgi:hypothetical protein